MIVCHCHGVSDRAIRRSVRSGHASVGAVARACGAGTGCAGCAPLVKQLVLEEREASARDSHSAGPMHGSARAGKLLR